LDTDRLTLLGKVVIPWVIRDRNRKVSRYLKPGKSLLDIGCGHGYLLRMAPCQKNIGIDELQCYEYSKDGEGKIIESCVEEGFVVERKLHFEDHSFDYVTIIAVIEHLHYPDEIIRECHRVLKRQGLLIMTTPFPIVEKILLFMDKGSYLFSYKKVKDAHIGYYNLESMNQLTRTLFELVEYKKFQFGVNQLFVYTKIG
jgi:2-polyprenyl-3-methyl-5-hydroxy-6-metoxy-1,4-benzoquinol methylase